MPQFTRTDNTAKRVIEVSACTVRDDSPDASYLEQDGFEDRLKAYRNDEFSFIGIRAKAVYSVRGVLQTVYSGGLYGIESDSGNDYLKEVAQEELKEVGAILMELGFTADEIREKTLEF